jgi:hypothetical protein
MTKQEAIKRVKGLYRCDSARIIAIDDKLFMIIGYKDYSENWIDQDGAKVHNEYTREQIIGTAHTPFRLWQSARNYKKVMKGDGK